jgi:lysophospholipase L1-like esterase
MTWVPRHRAAMVSPYDAMTFAPAFRFGDQTLRQIIHLHQGGTNFRVHLSNRFGRSPLEIGELRLARHAGNGAIVPDTDTSVTVGGVKTVTIAPGESVVTDQIPFSLSSGELAVSMHVVSGPLATHHNGAYQTGYIAAGNATAATDLPDPDFTTALFFIEGVDVLDESGLVVVAFGDSITDGEGTTIDANQRYPDHLSRRLGTSVLNLGISGNRLLRDGFGKAGLTRFQHDVLDVPGVTHVIIGLGVNDIGMATMYDQPQPTADDIITGLTTLAGRTRAAGVVPIGATLVPNADTVYSNFFSPLGEQIRLAVNEWIRTTGEYTAVLDTDAALRDPGRPEHYRPDLDSGDHLHPNDVGAAAIAQAIDLAVFDRA